MEITGKIVKLLDQRSGVTERGEWMVQSYLLETSGNYPKKMQFEVYGKDRIEKLNVAGLMSANKEVTIWFDIEASEYNGKWYNRIRAYDVREYYQKPKQEPTPQPTAANADVLPFV